MSRRWTLMDLINQFKTSSNAWFCQKISTIHCLKFFEKSTTINIKREICVWHVFTWYFESEKRVHSSYDQKCISMVRTESTNVITCYEIKNVTLRHEIKNVTTRYKIMWCFICNWHDVSFVTAWRFICNIQHSWVLITPPLFKSGSDFSNRGFYWARKGTDICILSPNLALFVRDTSITNPYCW